MPPLGRFHAHSNNSLSRKTAIKRKPGEGTPHGKEKTRKPGGPREQRPVLGDRTNREKTFEKQEEQTAARQADEQLEQKAKVSAEFIKKQEEALKYWNTRAARPTSASSHKELSPEQRRREFQSETERRRLAAREKEQASLSSQTPLSTGSSHTSKPTLDAKSVEIPPPSYSHATSNPNKRKYDTYDQYNDELNNFTKLRQQHSLATSTPPSSLGKRGRDPYQEHELESQQLGALRQHKRQKTEHETNLQTKEETELKEALAKSQKEADDLKAKEQADLDRALKESELDAEKLKAKKQADLKLLEQDQANLDRALAESELHHNSSNYGRALAASSGHKPPPSFFSSPGHEKPYTPKDIQAARNTGSIKEGKKKAVDEPPPQALPIDPIVEAEKKALADFRLSLPGPSRMDWYS